MGSLGIRPRVCVVGAGIAGMSACLKFVQGGVDTVCLEARDRIGGRMFTNERGYDMGCSWIHGVSLNPLVERCDASHWNLELIPTDLDSHFTLFKALSPSLIAKASSLPPATVYNPQLVERMKQVHYTALEEISQIGKQREENPSHPTATATATATVTASGGDQPIDRIYCQLVDFDNRPEDEKAVLQWFRVLDENINGGCFENLSLNSFHVYLEGEGHSMIKGGYGRLMDKVFQATVQNSRKETCRRNLSSGSFELRLNHVVTDIVVSTDPQAPPVRVSYSHRNGNGNGPSTYSEFFDHVLVAVPVGVLKRKSIHFSPPLSPAVHQRTIDAVGFGTVEKLFLEFDRNFWESQHSHFGVVPVDDTPAQHPTFFRSSNSSNSDDNDAARRSEREFLYFMDYSFMTGRPTLLVWMEFQRFSPMEASFLRSPQMIERILSLLRMLFPVAADARLVYSEVSSWGSDLFCGGSWSSLPVGCTRNHLLQMQNWHADRVLFAGEYMHECFISTVQGALLTGERQADKILDRLQDPRHRQQCLRSSL